MSYKTILATLNEVNQVCCIVKAATSIARIQKAFIIGLYVIPAIEFQMTAAGKGLPVENDGLQVCFKQQQRAFLSLERSLEKWKPVCRRDHAQIKS